MRTLLLVLALAACPTFAQEPASVCRPGLCGGPTTGEQGCYCHGDRRCWNTEARCTADAACVAADPVDGARLCAAKVKALPVAEAAPAPLEAVPGPNHIGHLGEAPRGPDVPACSGCPRAVAPDEGRSIPLAAGDLAPFSGQLIDPIEMMRRESVNERNVGELLKLKESKGDAIVSKPVFIAIVAGAVAVGVAVGVGATLAAKR